MILAVLSFRFMIPISDILIILSIRVLPGFNPLFQYILL